MKFTGSEQAIRFAYNMSDRGIMSKLDLTKAGGSEQGMSPQELHAQGALILKAIERLPTGPRYALVSMLAPMHHGKIGACLELADYLWPVLSGAFPGQGVLAEALLVWCRGKTVRWLAQTKGVSYRQAHAWKDLAGKKHNELYLHAVGRMDEILFADGGLELAHKNACV